MHCYKKCKKILLVHSNSPKKNNNKIQFKSLRELARPGREAPRPGPRTGPRPGPCTGPRNPLPRPRPAFNINTAEQTQSQRKRRKTRYVAVAQTISRKTKSNKKEIHN